MDSLISPLQLKKLAESWLEEDLPSFDVGGFVVSQENQYEKCFTAKLYCKQQCVLAGCQFFDAVFHQLNCTVDWMVKEGAEITQVPSVVALVKGPAARILLGERPALNCLSRASGVAARARRLVRLCDQSSATSMTSASTNQKSRTRKWAGRIAATRKTTPGFRLVEKYAAFVGGADSHRYDLSAMVMLKDNHVTACGGNIREAVKKARSVCGFSQKIEIEARNAQEALDAAESGAEVVMLDNFSAQDAQKTAEHLKSTHPHLIVEVSGGINEQNITDYCSEYVDVISLGALTQGYPCIDFSLKLSEANE